MEPRYWVGSKGASPVLWVQGKPSLACSLALAFPSPRSGATRDGDDGGPKGLKRELPKGGCPRNCKRIAGSISHCPIGREGGPQAQTREPGDRPASRLRACAGRGEPERRGETRMRAIDKMVDGVTQAPGSRENCFCYVYGPVVRRGAGAESRDHCARPCGDGDPHSDVGREHCSWRHSYR